MRPIIEGRTFGFCKLVADRGSCRILGCHVVGESALAASTLNTGDRKATESRPFPDYFRFACSYSSAAAAKGFSFDRDE